ncbi:GLUG motif-containing protein, partial [Sporosalibacterium faouarense]|uniref:GLUG motif-containing protein n=1 Tax=Sporosalibacterium faouarense TaxID=516123 RepID=UPI0024356123
PGTATGSTKADITETATSKFVVNITDSEVATPNTTDAAPTTGTNLVDNYISVADITTGVAEGVYLQVYDVDGSGNVAGFYQKQLTASDIKTNWQDYVAGSFAGGTGTIDDPYQISSAEELALLASWVNDDDSTNNGDYYELTQDIDLSAHEWTPIGINNGALWKVFSGYFDGKGYKISNVNIGTGANPDNTYDYAGLFGDSSGTIQNVGVSVNIYSFRVSSLLDPKGGFIGGLVASNGGIINNSYVTGTIQGGDNAYVGGLVGYNGYNGTINNSYASGNVTGGSSSYVGGLIGSNSTEGTIINGYYNSEQASASIGMDDNSQTVTGKTTADMKLQAFVNELNDNKSGHAGWYAWVAVANDYPTLDATSQPPEITPPTNLVFSSNTDNDIFLSFTASDTANGYLIVRKTGAEPSFVPASGTSYTAGAQGEDEIVAVGTETSFTESSATVDTEYYYTIYPYKGSGASIAYLTNNPLSGKTIIKSGNKVDNQTINSSTKATSAVFPDAGVSLTFPEGIAQDTTISVEKVNNEPTNFMVKPNVRRVSPMYFNVTANPDSPGNYTLILDFSSLGLTQAKWEKFVILKRADANSPWQDVVKDMGATIVNRQTDGIWGKFTITGLSSFSQFSGGEGYTAVTHTVTSAANDGSGSLRQVLLDATAGDVVEFDTEQMGSNSILLSAPIQIDKDITINGAGKEIKLDGNNTTRVLDIIDGVSVKLENLTIQNGKDSENIVGGINNEGSLTLLNCLVIGNKAIGIGEEGYGGTGGILQEVGFATVDGFNKPTKLVLINSTIAGNDGEADNDGVGGVVVFEGTVEIYNSIVYGNTGADAEGYFEDGTLTSYNSLYGFNDAAFNITGSDNIFAGDPKFVGTGEYPYMIQVDSQAIDAGSDNYINEIYDIRGAGFDRKVGTVDMGAYEYKETTLTNWQDSGNMADFFPGGTGTKDDPYQISSAEELSLLASVVNNEETAYTKAYYVLTQDIDLAAHQWTPIGIFGDATTMGSNKVFGGNFNGQGHVVSNVEIGTAGNPDGANYYVGLFGASNGTIENIGVKVSIVSSTANSRVGGLVGWNGGMIYNSYAIGDIAGGASSTGTGGLVGSNARKVINSYAAVSMTGNADCLGGLIGYNYSTITDGYYDSTVTGSIEGIGKDTQSQTTTSMTTADMQSQAFVDTLNLNRSGHPDWYTWVAVANDYPTLDATSPPPATTPATALNVTVSPGTATGSTK